MVRVVPQRELRNNIAKVIEAVAAGQSFRITRNGSPVAELSPVRTTRRHFVPMSELVALISSGPHLARELFRADLDRFIEPGL
jgi:prevent-host-death family protein